METRLCSSYSPVPLLAGASVHSLVSGVLHSSLVHSRAPRWLRAQSHAPQATGGAGFAPSLGCLVFSESFGS